MTMQQFSYFAEGSTEQVITDANVIRNAVATALSLVHDVQARDAAVRRFSDMFGPLWGPGIHRLMEAAVDRCIIPNPLNHSAVWDPLPGMPKERLTLIAFDSTSGIRVYQRDSEFLSSSIVRHVPNHFDPWQALRRT